MAHQCQGYCPLSTKSCPLLTDIGEQNIRKMLYTGDTSQNILSAGTWGLVYKITEEYDERLLLTYGADRLRMGQTVMVKTMQHQNNVLRLPVIMYWDPRNTRDGCNLDRYLNSGEDQRRKWDTAITRMKSYGIPTWYVNRVENTVRGILDNYGATDTESRDFSILYKIRDNSLYVNPQQLFYIPPTTTEPTAPLQIQGNRGRIQGQASIGRVEKAIPGSPKPLSKATSASQPRGEVAAGKAERAVATPEPSSKPKSASTPATKSQGQVPIGRAEQAIPRKPTPIGRAEQAIARQPNSSKPQFVAKAQPPAVQHLPKPQTPKPPSTPKRNGLGLNLQVKKRKPDSSHDGGQTAKKATLKKPLPGPSSLRHGTPA
jgi:hypothetical protein